MNKLNEIKLCGIDTFQPCMYTEALAPSSCLFAELILR